MSKLNNLGKSKPKMGAKFLLLLYAAKLYRYYLGLVQKEAKWLMDMHIITNHSYYLVLVQCTLSHSQQEAHILERDLPASTAY